MLLNCIHFEFNIEFPSKYIDFETVGRQYGGADQGDLGERGHHVYHGR